MINTASINKTREIISKLKKTRRTIGFVPTMGALHQGHLSLVRAAKKSNDFVVVSIFVNPVQFGQGEDLQRYPKPFRRDKKLLIREGVDLLFSPSAKTMYGNDYSTYVNENKLSNCLCSKSRPGHFKGVCTVVAKLFNIILPDVAYFGAKDFQQAQIIKKMVSDLNFPVKIKVMPIVRDKDGLAMSSRNAYLSGRERSYALRLNQALQQAKKMVKSGEKDVFRVVSKIKKVILCCDKIKIDYVEIRDAKTLATVKTIKNRTILAVAVFLGKTRLIDNILL